MPGVALDKQQAIIHNIFYVFEFYLWQTIPPEQNVIETPNFRCTMRWMCTINGGSHPLVVLYVFRTSESNYTWWPIMDNFLCVWNFKYNTFDLRSEIAIEIVMGLSKLCLVVPSHLSVWWMCMLKLANRSRLVIIKCDSFQLCRPHHYLKIARNTIQWHSRKGAPS